MGDRLFDPAPPPAHAPRRAVLIEDRGLWHHRIHDRPFAGRIAACCASLGMATVEMPWQAPDVRFAVHRRRSTTIAAVARSPRHQEPP